jgi:TonB-dependent starch-binding outer membrane protein SusC
MKKSYFILTLLGLLLSTGFSFAQINVSGKVTEANSGEGLAGVNVIVKGTTNGTLVDTDGNYTLTVAEGDILVYSFIGLKTQEIVVTPSSTVIDVAMVDDFMSLDEIVVTGLASSIKRSNLANAVGTVSGEQLTGTTGQSTLDGALYGKLTGVNIVASSGAPGGGSGVRLRGISSIKGNNQPLYIIDGVYMSNAEIPSGLRNASGANRANEENASTRIADLDPSDVESVEVLKGASAAAIYGTRANAGVIIITTKMGRAGKTKVNVSQDFGFSTVQNLTGLRNWNDANVDASYNLYDSLGNLTSSDERIPFNAAKGAGKIFDYEKELYGETGKISNTKVSVSGGNDKTSFYLGTSIRREDGIVKNTGFDRNSIRLNIKHKINDRITISSNSNYVNSITNRGFSGNENQGGLSYGYNLAYTRPWYDLHPDEFGNYPNNPTSFGNMLQVRDVAKNDDEVNRFIQGGKVDINIVQNSNTQLKLTMNGGIDFFIDESFIYIPETHQGQVGKDNGFIGVGKNTFTQANYQSFLVFNKYLMNGDLTLSTQVGISYLNFTRDLVYNQTTQLIPGQTSLEQGASKDIEQNRENEEEFGQVIQEEVNYKDQIIGTIGLRQDKSSLNGDPNKYYNFLKGSLAVNIAKFDFWSVDQVSQLKLRAAYGETGSSATYGSLITPLDATNIGGSGGTIISAKRGTPDLFPETSSEIEFGVDLGLLDDRIGIEFTSYTRKVNDLLFDQNLPTSSGFETTVLNDADLKNTGIEVAIIAKPISNSKIDWTTSISYWKNKAELTRLGVAPFVVPDNGFGLGLGTFYLQEGGLLTSIYQFDADRNPVAVANSEPDFQMSFFNQVHFLKNFDFSFLLHWKKGGDALNLTALLMDDGFTNPIIDDRGGSQYADTYIEDAGYMRLREVALYYTVPKSVHSSVFKNTFEKIKLGVSGRNLWTKTDYSGYDPEVSTNGSGVISNGLDVTPFPSSKQVYFHLDVTF